MPGSPQKLQRTRLGPLDFPRSPPESLRPAAHSSESHLRYEPQFQLFAPSSTSMASFSEYLENANSEHAQPLLEAILPAPLSLPGGQSIAVAVISYPCDAPEASTLLPNPARDKPCPEPTKLSRNFSSDNNHNNLTHRYRQPVLSLANTHQQPLAHLPPREQLPLILAMAAHSTTATTSLPTTDMPGHQSLAAAEFAPKEFLRPDVVDLWSYVKELYFGGVESWGEHEIRWLKPRWEALVPALPRPSQSPTHTLPTDQHVRAILEFLSEVHDLSGAKDFPGWYILPNKRDYLTQFKLFILTGSIAFSRSPGRRLTTLTASTISSRTGH
ncbi:hypothetical protein DXG01_003560 [Tephrocybe rancida]|nr:hypothetical protein DXG01_003560 [Tephrocybe rancida]